MKVTRHASSNSVGTTGFTNPGNAYASDNSYATAAPGTNSTISSYFGGFDFASYIPAGAQIHSVTVGIERKMSTTASTASTTALAYDNTTAIGTVQTSTAEPTSDTVWEYTPSSLPTITQVRSADFRVLVGAKRGSGSTGYTMSLDDVYVTVDYTQPSSGQILQIKRGIVNGSASTTLSFDTLPTVGNTIVVVAAAYAGNLASGSVTDNQSHTYTQRGKIEADSGTDAGDLCQYHTTVATSSGTFTVTINPDGSSADITWMIMEVGSLASSPYDTAVTAQAGSDSASASTGNITPNENNCLLIAAVSHTSTNNTITETLSGCTLIDEIEGGTTFMPLSVIYKKQTTATAEAATWTIGAAVEWICDVVSYKAATSGGTTYEQSASGAVTPDGAIVKDSRKPVAGAITPAGVIVRAVGKILAGAMAPAGTIVKSASKIFTGGITPAGVVIKSARKILAGAVEPSGVLAAVKTALVSLAGALTPAGEVVKSARKVLAGAITPAGVVIKSTRKVLAGAITPAGNVIRSIAKTMAGAIAAAGVLVAEKVTGATEYLQEVAGALTSSGGLAKATNKAVSGALTSAGAVVKAGRKALSGALTSAGAIVLSTRKVLAGALSSSGVISKKIYKSFAGAFTSSGVVNKLVSKILAGAVSFIGEVATYAHGFIHAGARVKHRANRRIQIFSGEIPEILADDREEINANERPEIKANQG